jgi:hypothetical protein
MSEATLQAEPDIKTRPDAFAERVAARIAQQKLANNLFELTDHLPTEYRAALLSENRAIRERFPHIEKELGGALPVDDAPDYTSKAAAKIVGMLGSDGAPTDAFYTFARTQLGAYETPAGLRIPRDRLEAFRKGGGNR